MDLNISLFSEINTGENLKGIKEFAEQLLLEELSDGFSVDISILFCSNKKIKEINKNYRKKDRATDVLSFPYEYGTNKLSGEIVISLEKVREQAEEYGHTYQRELMYVLTHGLLHLLGYDHLNDEDKEVMRKKEEYHLEKISLGRI